MTTQDVPTATRTAMPPRKQNTISEIPSAECLALLGGSGVGRVAFVGRTGLVIHPVNYLVDRDTIVVRTSPYTLLAENASGQVAFEVDELDPWLSAGWSVLVTGRCAPVDDPDEAAALRKGERLHSWAEGQRNLFLRITPQQITGRRVS
jgi:nitroimidazol reductase NimA-like FMN-containing flavoprotein (pyridoxamine 5'-phosphate oxidase superfamily)